MCVKLHEKNAETHGRAGRIKKLKTSFINKKLKLSKNQEKQESNKNRN